MMGFNGYGMMNWGQGVAWFGFLGFIFWAIILIDLTLLGVWLWKQIERNK